MTDTGFATLDDIDAFYAYNLDREVEKDLQQFIWENNIEFDTNYNEEE